MGHILSPEITDRDELPGYRPVNGWAIASLLLGLASIVGFLHPMLWLVPVAGIVVGALTILRIDRQTIPQSGRAVAVLGVAASVCFLAAAPARLVSRQSWLVHQATPLAEAWLDLIRHGELYKAHELMTAPALRRPLDDTLAGAYQNDQKALQSFEKFSARAPVQTLVSVGATATFRLIDAKVALEQGPQDVLLLVYEVSIPQGASRKTLYWELVLERDPEQGSRAKGDWRVANMNELPGPPK